MTCVHFWKKKENYYESSSDRAKVRKKIIIIIITRVSFGMDAMKFGFQKKFVKSSGF